MKRRTWKKMVSRRVGRRATQDRRLNDRHDRIYVLAFMRECIASLARTDIDVDEKIHTVAAIARCLAPSIMSTRRAKERESKDG